MKAKFGLIGCGLIGQKRGKHLEKFRHRLVCDKSEIQWRLLKSRPSEFRKFHWAVTMLTLYLLLPPQPINPNCKASIAQRFPCFH